MCYLTHWVYAPNRQVKAPESPRLSDRKWSIRLFLVGVKLSAWNPVWGQEKGERNASLLMAAPGLEEGRDTGRGGFNEGNAEEEGGGRGRQLGPSALWEDSQAALENTGCGHAGGENGFRHPPNPTPNRPHTRTHTHNSILSIPLLTLSCLSPLLSKEPVC